MDTFKKPLKLSDLMNGTTFELNSRDNQAEYEEEVDGMFWNEEIENLDNFKNPCETTFAEWKADMSEVLPGIWKKTVKKGSKEAKVIELSRTRVMYHRNLYMEGDDHPFDSTYLNNKTDGDEICLPMKNGNYIEGILDALGTMKEGEKSFFIISYKKMFKELGCPPRIRPKADILCEINVLKVGDVGDQEAIKELMNNNSETQKFADVKKGVEESRIRACDWFSAKEYNKAIRIYQQILQIVQISDIEGKAENDERNELVALLHRNLAVCFNRKEEWAETINHIHQLEEFVNIDEHPKALYAKGLALMKLGENDKASEALVKAQKLNPLSNEIIVALEELQQRKKGYNDFLKNFSKNLKLN